jgi:tRNA (guanine-N7-)-methyltransferase
VTAGRLHAAASSPGGPTGDAAQPEAESTPDSPRLLFYGRRQGRRLRPGRQRLVDELLPRLRIELPQTPGDFDPAALFSPRPAALWLEIGFGGGEHLAAQAARHPGIGFLGSEVFVNGVATLLAAVEHAGLDNIRLWPDDARPLLDALPAGCLERVFLLFPDPWPKHRHAFRRFIGPENLARLARVLQPGGELRVASDDPAYVAWTLRHLRAHPAFRWCARHADDWRRPPEDWSPTRYEAKAMAAGRKPAYLRFARR